MKVKIVKEGKWNVDGNIRNFPINWEGVIPDRVAKDMLKLGHAEALEQVAEEAQIEEQKAITEPEEQKAITEPEENKAIEAVEEDKTLEEQKTPTIEEIMADVSEMKPADIEAFAAKLGLEKGMMEGKKSLLKKIKEKLEADAAGAAEAPVETEVKE